MQSSIIENVIGTYIYYIIKICPLYLFSYQFIIFTTFYKVKVLQGNAIINKKKNGTYIYYIVKIHKSYLL